MPESTGKMRTLIEVSALIEAVLPTDDTDPGTIAAALQIVTANHAHHLAPEGKSDATAISLRLMSLIGDPTSNGEDRLTVLDGISDALVFYVTLYAAPGYRQRLLHQIFERMQRSDQLWHDARGHIDGLLRELKETLHDKK